MSVVRETQNGNIETDAMKPVSSVVSSVRSTRSKDNPEFIAKQKLFMAKIHAATSGSDDYYFNLRPDTPTNKRKRENSNASQGNTKKKKNKVEHIQELQHDNCCWECHKEGQFICCEMCPRVFHLRCTGLEKEPEEDWACNECHSIMEAENADNRSRAMQLISVDQLCTLLKYALTRVKTSPAMVPFCKPVDATEFPTYWEMVLHPVDFTTLEQNIKKKIYGSTEAFISDSKWIVHNSVIFNGAQSKVTQLARTLIKMLKDELSEIETCPDCYENAHQKPETWFTEACRLAHPIVWARLKGFPFWPAKAVKWKDTHVDVRFFGRHNRSWVPLKECFLLSEQMPSSLKNKNKTLENDLMEVGEHISNLRERFGKFNYANHKTAFNPYDTDQIRILLPLYKGPPILRIRSSARSSSRQSGTDDETSSIASTDSGTFTHNRKRKKLMRDRISFNNTPDTELDFDSSNQLEDKDLNDIVPKQQNPLHKNCQISKDSQSGRPPEEAKDGERLKHNLYADENSEIQEGGSEKFEVNEEETVNDQIIQKNLNEDLDVRNKEIDPQAEENLELDQETEENLDQEMEGNVDLDQETEENIEFEQKTEENLEFGQETEENEELNQGIEENLELNQGIEENLELNQGTGENADLNQESEENEELDQEAEENEELDQVADENEELDEEAEENEELDEEAAENEELYEEAEENEELDEEAEENEELDQEDEELGQEAEENEEQGREAEENEELGREAEENEELDDEAEENEALDQEAEENEALDQEAEENEALDQGAEENEELDQEAEENDKLDQEAEENEELDQEAEENEELDQEAEENAESDQEAELNEELDQEAEKNGMLDQEAKKNGELQHETEENLESDKENEENLEPDQEMEEIEDLDDENEVTSDLDQEKEDAGDDVEINHLKKQNLESHEEDKNIEETDKLDVKNSGNTTEANEEDEQNNIEDDDEELDESDGETNNRLIIDSFKELTENNKEELNQIQKLKPGPLSKKRKLISQSSSGLDDSNNSTSSVIENLNKINELLRNESLNISETRSTPPVSSSSDSGLSNETKSLLSKLPISNSIKFASISSVNEALDKGKEESEDLDSEEERMEINESNSEEGRRSISKDSESLSHGAEKLFNISSAVSGLNANLLKSINLTKITSSEATRTSNSIVSKLNSPENSAIDYKKLFHNNITISSKAIDGSKGESHKKIDKEASDDAEASDSASESLLEAVRLVQNIGNIAIKRLDSRTMEHVSGGDKVTISVANKNYTNKEKSQKKTENSSLNHLASIAGNVSVTKAGEIKERHEKNKISNVDTTRMSPSISIIPVSVTNSASIDTKPKPKITSPSPILANHHQGTMSTGSRTSSSVSPSISASPSFAPPMQSSNLSSPTSTSNVRPIFNPHMPGLQMPGTSPSLPSPGIRMMHNAPAVLMGARMPMVRHIPPEAGPVSMELHKHSQKLAEMMRNSLEEVLGGLVGIGTPEARVAALQLELERSNFRHQQEIIEVRHNADVLLVEMRANLDAEKQRAVEEAHRQLEQKVVELRRQMEMQLSEKVNEVKRNMEAEKQRAIEDTKKKQWCANCGKEALFFCCWNTSYCDYPCQQSHWPQHMSVCGQNSDSGGANNNANKSSEGVATSAPMEGVNGDLSANSSRGPTPNQINKNCQSPIFSELGARATVSPAGSNNLVNTVTVPMNPGVSPLGQPTIVSMGNYRQTMNNPVMATQYASHIGAKIPQQRFLQHSIIPQQPMFGGMDPRMIMMMGRNMPGPSVMMRGHYRPRYM